MFNINTKIIYLLKVLLIFFLSNSIYILFLQNFLTNQNNYYKFFFIHVPFAWLSIFTYTLMILICIYLIIYNNYNYMFIIYDLNILCFLYLSITLLTGMIWGQLTWGSYWEWDIRLLSTFLLWFCSFFLNFFYLWNKYLGCLFIILSSINIPIIKFGIFWFNSLHQFNSININNSLLDIFFLLYVCNSFICSLCYTILIMVLFSYIKFTN